MVSSTLKTIGQKKSNFSDLGGKECQKLGQEHEHSCYSDTLLLIDMVCIF